MQPGSHLGLDLFSGLKSSSGHGGCENIHTLICTPRAGVSNYLGMKEELFRGRVWHVIDFGLLLRCSDYF